MGSSLIVPASKVDYLNRKPTIRHDQVVAKGLSAKNSKIVAKTVNIKVHERGNGCSHRETAAKKTKPGIKRPTNDRRV